MPFNIGPTELILILIIVLVIFGAGKLVGVGRALGQSIREFKSAVQGDTESKPEVMASKEKSEANQAEPQQDGARS
ncbi:MAG: twin-arginine translocase TatA/TatE family subunit [Clostridia bacterium]|nr:twin-arginine translocase TatA/TatE family subunit [Clostridia bacterium]